MFFFYHRDCFSEEFRNSSKYLLYILFNLKNALKFKMKTTQVASSTLIFFETIFVLFCGKNKLNQRESLLRLLS